VVGHASLLQQTKIGISGCFIYVKEPLLLVSQVYGEFPPRQSVTGLPTLNSTNKTLCWTSFGQGTQTCTCSLVSYIEGLDFEEFLLMMWATIFYNRRTNLERVQNKFNRSTLSRRYRAATYAQCYWPTEKGVSAGQCLPPYSKGGHGILTQNNIKVLPWPWKSPDLNPIDHLWDELDKRIRQGQPHLNHIKKCCKPIVPLIDPIYNANAKKDFTTPSVLFMMTSNVIHSQVRRSW